MWHVTVFAPLNHIFMLNQFSLPSVCTFSHRNHSHFSVYQTFCNITVSHLEFLSDITAASWFMSLCCCKIWILFSHLNLLTVEKICRYQIYWWCFHRECSGVDKQKDSVFRSHHNQTPILINNRTHVVHVNTLRQKHTGDELTTFTRVLPPRVTH